MDSLVERAGKEFTAVLFAGHGHGLAPLTIDSPKCLLPIANRALLEHVRVWVEHAGITHLLLVCPQKHKAAIHHHIHSDLPAQSALRVDIHPYDDDQPATCALLRHLAPRIPGDFVILPCDLIPSPAHPLASLLNTFRVDALTHRALATTFWYRQPDPNPALDEWGPPTPAFPIVWHPESNTLLHIDTPDDHDRHQDDIHLRMSLLAQYPSTKLSSAYQDSHVYVCSHSVLQLLHEKPHFMSLREEFFPWLCTLQYQPSKQLKYAKPLSAHLKADPQSLSREHSSLLSDDNRHNYKISVVINRTQNDALRVNSLQSFYEINKRILATTTFSLPVDQATRSLIDQRAQISTDSIVGDSTQISERTTIKKSVIGRHCVIGKMVKISNSILFDHCVVEDGAKLESCILGKNTQIGGKADLTRCITQAGYEVSSGESLKGEKLEVSDWMAGHDDSSTASDPSGSDTE